MGVWGTGLYSADFALDLRATVSAVTRLPFDPDRLVELLCDAEPSSANNPSDEDHTTFWLVLGDQFAKRGIACDRVRDKALAIIDRGIDVAMLEKRGMKASGLTKRSRMLAELRARIVTAPTGKPRKVLRKPQRLLMEAGDVLVYPTCAGKCINPYFATKELNRQYTKDGPLPWKQDGWAAMVVILCGRAFEYLAWYLAVTTATATIDRPSLDVLRGDVLWRLRLPGTCSPVHFKKMELEKIGAWQIDPQRAKDLSPGQRLGISAPVSDRSIANSMRAAPYASPAVIPKVGEGQRGSGRTILGIAQLLHE